MHAIAEYIGSQKTTQGDVVISFAVDVESDAIDKLEKWLGEDVVLDVDRFRNKRSLNANRYFWQLCSQIAKKLGIKLETAYILQLTSHGVFDDIEVISDAVDLIKPLYRHCEVIGEEVIDRGNTVSKMSVLRCWTGSSHYDTKQMADLINGTVNDCEDLGIETWSQEEIQMLIENWRGNNERHK